MRTCRRLGVWLSVALCARLIFAMEYYVNAVNGSDLNVGTNYDAPLKSIQAAIDKATSGDTVSVSPGVYAPIRTSNKDITIMGGSTTYDPYYGYSGSTVIDGGFSERCADLGADESQTQTILKGLMLRNGRIDSGKGAGARGGTLFNCVISCCTNASVASASTGGGAFGSRTYDCVFEGNCAAYGGGLYGGSADRCAFFGNFARSDGGACHSCQAFNCLMEGNRSGLPVCGPSRGGACDNTFCVNCTFVNNAVDYGEGGIVAGQVTVANCLFWNNDCGSGAAFGQDVTPVCCYTGDDPGFKDAVEMDYRLLPDSPCVNAGTNVFVVGSGLTDFGGNARVVGGTVDIGCYECYARWPNPDIGDNMSKEALAGVLSEGSFAAKVLECSGDVSYFTNGLAAGLPFEDGICLDTGSREVFKRTVEIDADLTNVMAQVGTSLSIGGHLSVFEIEATATSELLSFHYAYASSEFDQGSTFSDPFALLVSVNSGAYENLAKLDNGMPVSIRNLRAGRNKTQNNSGDRTAKVSSTEYFGYWSKSAPTADDSLLPYVWYEDVIPGFSAGHPVDGITVEFGAEKKVTVGDHIKLKFVIADTGDTIYDSFVFIKAGSLGFAEIAGAPIADPATDVSTNGFVCNWHEVTGAVSYRVDVASDPDFTQLLPGCSGAFAEDNQFRVDGSFPQNGTYYYRVRAVGEKGTVSGNSNVIAVVIPTTVVTAPTITPAGCETTSNLTVTIVNNHPGAKLYYSTDGFNPTTYSSTIASGGTIVVTPDTTVKAIAVFGGVHSPVTTQTYAKPKPQTPPGVVPNVQATDGTESEAVIVTWDESSSESPVLSYEVSRAKKGTDDWVVVVSNTTSREAYVSAPKYIAAGVDYVFRVRARNDAGWGKSGSDEGWARIYLEGPAEMMNLGGAATNLCLQFVSSLALSYSISGDATECDPGYACPAPHAAASGWYSPQYLHLHVPANTSPAPKQGTVVATAGATLDHPATVTFKYAQAAPPQLTGVVIGGGAPSLEGGSSAAFTATATYSDGSTRDVTAEATWTVVSGGGYGTIGEHTGVLETHETTELTASMTVRATYAETVPPSSPMSDTKTVAVTFTSALRKPVSLEIAGPVDGILHQPQEYHATVTFNDATTNDVTFDARTAWSVNPGVPQAEMAKTATGLGLTPRAVGVQLLLAATFEAGADTVSDSLVVTVPSPVTLPEALDVAADPNLEITTGGTPGVGNGWYGQTAVSHDGADAGQSGYLLGAGESWMETTVTNAGTVSFWWKVSSEPTYDNLRFEVNGEVKARISGKTNDWAQLKFAIPAGEHVLRWVYSKDETGKSGADAAWVDQLVWKPLQPPAPATGAAAAIRASDGTSPNAVEVEWDPFVSEWSAVTYELSRQAVGSSTWETLVADASGLRYVDAGVKPGLDYTYRVRARNDGGWSDYIADDGWRAVTLEVDPASIAFGFAEAVRKVTVVSNCAWTVAVKDSGFEVQPGSDGFDVKAAFNDSLDERQTTVTVTAGSGKHAAVREIPVVQAARPPKIDVGFVAPYEDWRTRLQITTNDVDDAYAPVSVFAKGEELTIGFGWTNRSEVAMAVPTVRFRIYRDVPGNCVALWDETNHPSALLDVGGSEWSGGWTFAAAKVLNPGNYRLEAEIAPRPEYDDIYPEHDESYRAGVDADQHDNIAIFRFAVKDPALELEDVLDGDRWRQGELKPGNDFAQPPHLAVHAVETPAGAETAPAVQFGPYVPMDGVNGRSVQGGKALDLVFLMDYSGSMDNCINGLVNNIGNFIDTLILGDPETGEPGIENLRIKIVGFSDEKSDKPYINWFHEGAFSTDRSQLKSELAFLRDKCWYGGCNGGESSYDALYYLCKGWTPNKTYPSIPDGQTDTASPFRGTNECARVIILFTDEPPHVPFTAAGCGGKSYAELDQALREAGIELIIIGDGYYRKGDANHSYGEGWYHGHERYETLYLMNTNHYQLIETGGYGTLAKYSQDASKIRELAGNVVHRVPSVAEKVEPTFTAGVLGGGTLTFSWKNDSTSASNTFSFVCDNSTNVITCAADSLWHQETVELGEGAHQFTWSYGKEGYVGSVTDCGVLGNVVWEPWRTEMELAPTEFAVGHEGSWKMAHETENGSIEETFVGAGNLTVCVTNCNANWYVVTNGVPDWIALLSREGSGNGDITFQVATNEAHEARSAVITVRAGDNGLPTDEVLERTFTVVQAESPWIPGPEPQVLTVAVKPRWPWNDTVDIDFRVLLAKDDKPLMVTFRGVNNEGGELAEMFKKLQEVKYKTPTFGKSGRVYTNETLHVYDYVRCPTSGWYRVTWKEIGQEWCVNSGTAPWTSANSAPSFHTPAFGVELTAGRENGEGETDVAVSDTVRLDTRTTQRDGGVVMTGVEMIGHPTGGYPNGPIDPVPVDTTQLPNGMNCLGQFVADLPKPDGTVDYANDKTRACVINPPAQVAIEGGNIVTDTVWRADKVHVIRDNVFVQPNATLTIEHGTVVKFTYWSRIYIYRSPNYKSTSNCAQYYNLVMKGAYLVGARNAEGGNTFYGAGESYGNYNDWICDNLIRSQGWDDEITGLRNAVLSISLNPSLLQTDGSYAPQQWKVISYTVGQKWDVIPDPPDVEGKKVFYWFMPKGGQVSRTMTAAEYPGERFVDPNDVVPHHGHTSWECEQLYTLDHGSEDGWDKVTPIRLKINAGTGELQLEKDHVVYDGKSHREEVHVKAVKVGEDWLSPEYYKTFVRDDDKFISAGSYEVTVDFTADYTNSPTAYFTIEPRSLAECRAELTSESALYRPEADGGVARPTVRVLWPLGEDGAFVEIPEADRKAVTANWYDDGAWPRPGVYHVEVSVESGNFAGTLTNAFEILPNPAYNFKEYATATAVKEQVGFFEAEYHRAPRILRIYGLTNDVMSVAWRKLIYDSVDLNEYVRTNFVCWADDSEVEPWMAITDSVDDSRPIVSVDGNLTAEEIWEFLRAGAMSPSLPTDGSSATVVLKGSGEYVYTGKEIRPVDKVVLDGEEIDSSNYSLVYEGDLVNVGSAAVKAVFKNDYAGETKPVAFDIVPAALTESSVTVSPASAVFDGLMHKPKVTVSGGIAHSVDYGTGDFTSVGVYQISVTASGNHAGTVVCDFEIKKSEVKPEDVEVTLDVPSAEIKGSKEASGVDVRPKVQTVSDGERVYVEGVDYDVDYGDEDFTTVGQKTIRIVFKGGYSGEKTIVFEVTASHDELPEVPGDPKAEIDDTDPDNIVVRPGPENKDVKVDVPEGIDRAKVTVAVSPEVTSVTMPEGVKLQIVREVKINGKPTSCDIAQLLDLPKPDASGRIDLTAATVKEEYVREVLDPAEPGTVIELVPGDPVLTTKTQPGLVYTLWEGTALDALKDGDSTVGDGTPWTPEVSEDVKGKPSAFFTIQVGK